jgi:hypothetical protein
LQNHSCIHIITTKIGNMRFSNGNKFKHTINKIMVNYLNYLF